jgi:Flp pilus assembly protein protease CpaA
MPVILLLLLISIFDLKFHRIPNPLLTLLLVFSVFQIHLDVNLTYFFFTTASAIFFTHVSRCGYGDTKLVIVLLNLIVPRSQLMNYLCALVICSAISIGLHLIRNRSLRGELAFAPALCGAVLGLRP